MNNRKLGMNPLGMVCVSLGLLLSGCREEPPHAPPPEPVVSTQASARALSDYERDSALMVLRGNRMDPHEVMQAYDTLRKKETPTRAPGEVALRDSFAPSTTVVEHYPEAKLIITLRNGKVIDVKPMMESGNWGEGIPPL